MKVPVDLLPALLVPLFGTHPNSSIEADQAAVSSTYNNQSVHSTLSAALPLYTHHRHHGSSHPQNHDEEDGILRPRQGTKRIGVATKHKSKTSNECPQPPVLSCSAQADSTDSCCVVRPGGALVHAQFWDLGFGVENSWGIHGLWPDMCNGGFYENCDKSRAYSGDDIVSSLQAAGQDSLLDFMQQYWVSNDESAPDFWSHEWETHGTCVSTLEPSCLENYQTGEEVVPYFQTVVGLFQQLNTYQALSDAGIVPDEDQTYDLKDMQQAVESATGFVPDFVCKSSTVTTVQYYVNAEGPLQDGQFVQSKASRKSSCPKTGIKYPPKDVNTK